MQNPEGEVTSRLHDDGGGSGAGGDMCYTLSFARINEQDHYDKSEKKIVEETCLHDKVMHIKNPPTPDSTMSERRKLEVKKT
eukprot:15365119-Ditylum_brightwellii.AAC.2